MSIQPYRNESLIQMETYQTDAARADALVNQVRSKWALLREQGLAGDYPVEVLRSGGSNGGPIKVVEIFKWRARQSQIDAQNSPEYRALLANIEGLSGGAPTQDTFTQVVRGFNTNFPPIGGVELLKGVCSCLLTIDGMVEDYPMSVKNGIVLMHRSPRMDLDGDGRNEMYLKILMHGGEIIQAALGPIRVEQNFNRPNDGMVKSLGEGDRDFPAVGIWRVSWKIQTALGPVLTDPDQPLIFGPAIVNHYPPVGTHFHASTGEVKLILEKTGDVVGHLIPGELTAFDIVVSKDDEIYADILNNPPDDLFEVMEAHKHKVHVAAPENVPIPDLAPGLVASVK
ncbi:MAG TPA: hypothetical protein VN228_02165 [Pyrinomonadaceae bacterium]|nr:hypothetical protein [Pyrinomonadaceae bacterium]